MNNSGLQHICAVAEPAQFEDGSFLFKIYDRNKQVYQ